MPRAARDDMLPKLAAWYDEVVYATTAAADAARTAS